MTDVISFRTDKIEQLKKISHKKNISLSQLSSEIIDEYFKFNILKENYNMFNENKDLISLCFSLLSDSDLKKTSDFLSKEITKLLKTITNDYSIQNILEIYQSWYSYNNFTSKIFQENNYIKLACNNSMSKNWNQHSSLAITKSMKDFDYDVIVDSIEDGFYSFRIQNVNS